MKIFVIKEKRDEKLAEVTYGWLFYDEAKKEFQIRLCRDVDYWNCPVFFASFVKNGSYELDSNWSRIWVQQRILSWERQNLQEILK